MTSATNSAPQTLAGKRAVITGASRGIGRGIAIELARLGAHITINYFGSPKEAEEVCTECRGYGVEAHSVKADVGTQEGAESLVENAIKAMGGLDIAVSNAAYSDRHLDA
jgi:glucose 1-dehydrogenase